MSTLFLKSFFDLCKISVFLFSDRGPQQNFLGTFSGKSFCVSILLLVIIRRLRTTWLVIIMHVLYILIKYLLSTYLFLHFTVYYVTFRYFISWFLRFWTRNTYFISQTFCMWHAYLHLTRTTHSTLSHIFRKQRHRSRFSLFQGKLWNILQGILSVTD